MRCSRDFISGGEVRFLKVEAEDTKNLDSARVQCLVITSVETINWLTRLVISLISDTVQAQHQAQNGMISIHWCSMLPPRSI